MNLAMRRLMGVVIILVGLVGLVFGVYALIWVQHAADEIERDLVSAMDSGLNGLEVVSDTLVVAVQMVEDAGAVIESAATSSDDAAGTIDSMGAGVREMSNVIAFDLPDTIQQIEGTLPALEEAGAAIDKTLRTLSNFQFNATIPIINFPIDFGLGIDYNPPVPLDQAVAEIGVALGELPIQLSGIQASLLETNLGLGDTAKSMKGIGDSLSSVQGDMDRLGDVLGEYDDLVAGATDQARIIRRDLRGRIQGVRFTITGILAWLILSQIGPLYVGATLLVRPRPEPGGPR
jgi:hypothetical protein